jgi:hypothetical protein
MLLLQRPVLVLVFNQYQDNCSCLARWLGQETALWTSVCSVLGCSTPATYCQPAAAQALFIAVCRGEPAHSPSPAGFVYLKFSWTPAPSLFSSVKSYQPVTVAGLVYLQLMWGTSYPPLSCRACCMSATVGSLPHSKLTGGGLPNPPSLVGLFICSLCGEVPLPLSPELRMSALFATCPFQLLIIQGFFGFGFGFVQGRCQSV